MRWIGSPDTYKAKIWRSVARKIDYPAEFARIEAEAAAVNALDLRPAQKERQLEQLRRDWRTMKRQQRFAETGVNE